MKYAVRLAAACTLVLLSLGRLVAEEPVRVWEEPLVLPTYKKAADNPNPMFFREQSYQGASRVIYPYPAQDNLTSDKTDQQYNALYLENEYIKLCVLPEIGGRLFYATDKTNGYEMFYRQSAIKPAHIGMLGAWISGGIEWCVFHHHRASTYLPVDYKLSKNEDGSATIWIGEFEPRQRMRWTIGITLCPGSSAIEAEVRMFNRTPRTHSILYWANVATHVNEDYQVFFPPSTQVGTYHAKNQFIQWPIGRGTYLHRDYDGVDVSWWKNHPRPTSIFAHDLKEGFLAGYDHGKRAGTMHVANPHVVPGAKLWEWGRENTWDSQILTDSDGHYAELMAGAYSDNQPDYSWIKPGETKTARQTWYPLRDIRGAKAANEHAAVNLEAKDGRAFVGVNVTREFEDARVTLTAREKPFFEKQMTVSPAAPFTTEVALPEGIEETDVEFRLCAADRGLVISYRPQRREPVKELPKPVQPPKKPEEIESVEELYLTGLRIKQFHNARLDPKVYFLEALRRDPGNSRSNIQLGIDAARRGLYEESEKYFRTAVERISKNYTRPRDCEAYYQLGLVQKAQEKYDEAYDNLYRAVWDDAFRAAAYAQLAEIDCIRGDFKTALSHMDRSLSVNSLYVKGWGLKAMILRHLGRYEDALGCVDRALAIDPLDPLAHWERLCVRQHLRKPDDAGSERLYREAEDSLRVLRDQPQAYIEVAADYMRCGAWADAASVLERADHLRPGREPTVSYFMAYLQRLLGDGMRADRYRTAARQYPTDYCFPFRLESLKVLDWAIAQDPADSRAYYYRGCALYDRRPEEAMADWRKAVELEPELAVAHRNLGWGYAQAGEPEKAVAAYEEAIHRKADDPVYYAELDVLLEQSNAPIARRLALFEDRHKVIQQYENALVREIMVWVRAGRYDDAIAALDANHFHAKEGSRGLHEVHVDAHLLRGLAKLENREYEAALKDFQAAATFPANQQVVYQEDYDRNSEIRVLTSLAYEGLGQTDQAKRLLEQVAEGGAASSQRYYRGLAHETLGNRAKAEEAFAALVKMGENRLGGGDDVDFFAKFGAGTAKNVRQAEGFFLMGLGYLGQGDPQKARAAFEKAVALDASNTWAAYYAERCK